MKGAFNFYEHCLWRLGTVRLMLLLVSIIVDYYPVSSKISRCRRHGGSDHDLI